MNQGDVGRVETLFPPWINLFRATGKHKYAVHMTTFLTDIHFVYPERLKYVCLPSISITHPRVLNFHRRYTVCYNMLVNPTGKPGNFRGIDWVEESMINLYTKVYLICSCNLWHN
jgi:hypothetical protein